MRIAKRIATGTVAVAASLASVVAIATPASASLVNRCNDAFICVYEHQGYAGGIYGFHVQTLYGNRCWTYPASGQGGWTNGQVNNKITGVILNKITQTDQFYVSFWDANNCTGAHLPFVATNTVQAYSNLTNAGFNDRIGSVSLGF